MTGPLTPTPVPWWTRLRWRAEVAWAWVRRDVPPVDPRCTNCGGLGYFFAMGEEYTCACPAGEAYGDMPRRGAVSARSQPPSPVLRDRS